MKRLSASAFVLLAVLTCRVCYGQEGTSRTVPSPEVAKKLQALLDGFVSQPNVVNYVALVDGGPSRCPRRFPLDQGGVASERRVRE